MPWSIRNTRDTFAAMIATLPKYYFDAVDPVSFLMDREIRAVEDESGLRVTRVPFELRPAPAELTDPADLCWESRWSEAQSLTAESLLVPHLVPRSRKAHELFLHAETSGLGRAALEEIFNAFFVKGLDIGRVDILVGIGRSLGLDHTETKAVLDVDRFEAEAGHLTETADAAGVSTVPCLVTPDARLEGFHNQAAIGTLLAGR